MQAKMLQKRHKNAALPGLDLNKQMTNNVRV